MYTALTAEDAIAEYEKHFEQFGATGVRDLVAIDIVVGPVLDLTKSAIRKKAGVDEATLTGDDRKCLSACRAIAREYVANSRYAAIRAPSAARRGGETLMIYFETTGGIRSMMDGPDRVAITRGFVWHRR